MSAPRRLAHRLLQAFVELAPASSGDWAQAMLRELDFIRDDWAALYWALGSIAALCRHVVSGWRSWFKVSSSGEESGVNSTGKKAVGVGMGAFCALTLVGCAFGILRALDLVFPQMGIAHMEWTHWLAVLIIPETIFIIAAVALWRKKGPVAAGILTIGLLMAVHIAVHFALR